MNTEEIWHQIEGLHQCEILEKLSKNEGDILFHFKEATGMTVHEMYHKLLISESQYNE